MGNWKNVDGDDLHAVYYYFVLLEISQIPHRCRLRDTENINIIDRIN